jgi:uncharacterized Zn finger protein
MKQKITARVSFGCQSCGGSDLTNVGAVKTENERTYLMCQCQGCGQAVPIDLDAVVKALYEASPAQTTN